MFRLLGNDGKEYGPVTPAQLRQWIREGRAGGFTQVQGEAGSGWLPLRSVPEFADIFHVPPTLAAGNLQPPVPAVARLLAFGFFITAAINALFMLVSAITLLGLASHGTFQPGAVHFLSWGIGLLGLPIRVVCGIGLLRGREWARKLAIGFAGTMALYGGWGMIQTFAVLARYEHLTALLRAPTFVLSNLWNVVLLGFHVATVIVLCRRTVRAGFAASTHSV